jgi:hypothetical protein
MGLNLGDGRANGATVSKEELAKREAERKEEDSKRNDKAEQTPPLETASREGVTSRPHLPDTLEKPLESKAEVDVRLDPTKPVSGDDATAQERPEETFLDAPTPAEHRKDTLEGRDSNAVANANIEAEKRVVLEDEKRARESVADDATRYSSHPIMNYKVGRFQFEDGLLTLKDDEDVKEFEKLLDNPKFPRSERARIKKLDLSAAEAQSRAVRANQPKASKSIGSESGDRDPGKQVGKGTLGDIHGE